MIQKYITKSKNWTIAAYDAARWWLVNKIAGDLIFHHFTKAHVQGRNDGYNDGREAQKIEELTDEPAPYTGLPDNDEIESALNPPLNTE